LILEMLQSEDKNNSIMIKKSKQQLIMALVDLMYSCIETKNGCLKKNFAYLEQREAFATLYFKIADALSHQIGRKLDIFTGACFAHLGVLCLPTIQESKQR
jgi:hypothetical protein